MKTRLDLCMAALVGLLIAVLPAVAHGAKQEEGSKAPAAALEVAVRQEDGRSIVSIRDPEGTLAEPRITSSKRGYLLVFEGERIQRKRLDATDHRLDFVQVDQVRGRAVVRLAQARGHKGAIGDHVQQIPVPGGGLDLSIVDSLPPPAPPAAAPGPIESEPSPAPSAADVLAGLSDVPQQPEPAAAATAPGEAPEVAEGAASTALGPAQPAESDATAQSEAKAPSWLSDGENDGPARPWAWLLVPVLIAGAVAFVWSKKAGRKDPSEGMHVLEKVSLGPKQHIVRMRVADRELLLGVTEHQVGLITEVCSDTKALSTPGGAVGPTIATMSPKGSGADDRVAAFKNRLATALRTEAATRGVDAADNLAADGDEWVSEIPGTIDVSSREVA